MVGAEIAPETQGSGETESASKARGVGVFLLLYFAAFCPFNLGILFYGTQQVGRVVAPASPWCGDIEPYTLMARLGPENLAHHETVRGLI